MGAEAATPCAHCQRLQAQVDALTATVAGLQATVAQLHAQLAAARKDSSTSSKPPSSDIVKPPKPPPPPGQELVGGVLDQVGVAVIGDAAAQLAEDAGGALGLGQQQGA